VPFFFGNDAFDLNSDYADVRTTDDILAALRRA
jgi:hypothetical protein